VIAGEPNAGAGHGADGIGWAVAERDSESLPYDAGVPE